MTSRKDRSLVLLTLSAALLMAGCRMTREPLAAMAEKRQARLEKTGFAERDLAWGKEQHLRYFEAGKGMPLIFLHGVGDQGGNWGEVAPAFASRYRVIVADLPGHGASTPTTGDLPMASVVAGIDALVMHATAAEGPPAILVGNSLGAWLATLMAHRHPDKVARLVLVNGGALIGDRGAPSLTPKNREEAAKLMATLRDPSAPKLPEFVLDDIVRRAQDGPIPRLLRDLPGLIAHLLEGRLGEVKTPVDLLWGESDQLMKVAYAERQRAALPAARLTLIERCGHIPQVECPARFTDQLRRLLALPPPALPGSSGR